MKKFNAVIDSPIGKLGIVTEDNKVQRTEFLAEVDCIAPQDDFTNNVVSQLNAYFEDSNFQFDLPLKIEGRPFQKTVWCALRKIPLGKTKTYSDLADELSSGPRAVGNACRHNPIPIIVPCHRIVAKSGLGGFAGETAGTAVNIKMWLLNHENRTC